MTPDKELITLVIIGFTWFCLYVLSRTRCMKIGQSVVFCFVFGSYNLWRLLFGESWAFFIQFSLLMPYIFSYLKLRKEVKEISVPRVSFVRNGFIVWEEAQVNHIFVAPIINRIFERLPARLNNNQYYLRNVIEGCCLQYTRKLSEEQFQLVADFVEVEFYKVLAKKNFAKFDWTKEGF